MSILEEMCKYIKIVVFSMNQYVLRVSKSENVKENDKKIHNALVFKANYCQQIHSFINFMSLVVKK